MLKKHVYCASGTAGAVSFVAGFLPNGILAPIGGALADRLDRRTFAMVGTGVEGAIAAVLAVVVAGGNTNPYLITALVFLAGCVGAIRMPAPALSRSLAITASSPKWPMHKTSSPPLTSR